MYKNIHCLNYYLNIYNVYLNYAKYISKYFSIKHFCFFVNYLIENNLIICGFVVI